MIQTDFAVGKNEDGGVKYLCQGKSHLKEEKKHDLALFKRCIGHKEK